MRSHLLLESGGSGQRKGDGTIVQEPDAIGKSVNSATVEKELDPEKRYTVTIQADSNSGDMHIYATKLWPGDASGISEQPLQHTMLNAQCYNLKEQCVDDSYRGLVIQNGRKLVRR